MKKNKNICVLVTGAGYKEAKRKFPNNTAEIIKINGKEYKLNTGAVTAKLLVRNGFKVVMISRTKEVLANIKTHIIKETKCDPSIISYHAIDLLDENLIKQLIASLNKKETIWLVHSVGLGSQAYSLKGDNPYLPFTEITPEILIKEFEVPVKSLLLLIQNLLPIFKKQKETRIVIVNSMSAIRPYIYGYSHSSAKGGYHNAIRSLSLELSLLYKSIYITEILPGIVDTGLYDSNEVIKSVKEIAKTFGFYGKKEYNEKNFPLTSPSEIAKAILLSLELKAHVLSINIVAKDQFINMGA